jgi:polysaccharide export outer membrane protein
MVMGHDDRRGAARPPSDGGRAVAHPHFWSLMRLRSSALSLCLLLVVSGAHAQGATVGAAAIPTVSGPEAFRLRPGDVVRLAIKDELELSGDYPVLIDGTVMLPLVGPVQVSGVAFGAVERRVREAFAHELPNPVLALMPVIRVAVLGEVRAPGLYLMDGTFDVTEALANAGGLTPSGSMERITLLRDGRSERLQPAGETPLPVVGVQPGDQLVVGRRSWFAENTNVLVGAGTSVLIAAITTLLVR